MTRRRVLLATRVFTPEPVAAAFREEALAIALQDAGADVAVLTTSGGAGEGGADPRLRGVSRFPVKRDHQGQVRGYASYLSFDLPLALRLLAARRVDAIIAEPPPTTLLVATVLAAIRRVPLIVYAADVWADATDSVGGVPRWVRGIVRWAETTAWRRAARVLTISPGVQHRVEELTSHRAAAVMIGNGIDTDTFTPEGPDAGEEGPYFVYAGTVSEWQGAGVFLDAFAAVRARHPRSRLLFYSEGTGREELQDRVVAEGLSGIEFRDKISPAQVAAVLRGAVAGLSSITPGQGYEFALPTKIYAATACGTPVIHAGDGAAHERVEQAHLGWACAYDPGQVAAAMEQALAAHEAGGAGAPAAQDLRTWTLENASLAGCAALGAREVLEAL